MPEHEKSKTIEPVPEEEIDELVNELVELLNDSTLGDEVKTPW